MKIFISKYLVCARFCVLMALIGLVSCIQSKSSPVKSCLRLPIISDGSREDISAYLNRPITLIGMADNAHLGAIVVGDFGVVFLTDRYSWPPEKYGERVKVSGVLVKRVWPDTPPEVAPLDKAEKLYVCLAPLDPNDDDKFAPCWIP